MNTVPLVKDIVLLGGGHSHALLIRKWGMNPLPGVRLTLISRDVLTPYSGMLPGYLAGHYSFDDIHIDLSRLCRWANVRFIEATVTGLDPNAQAVMLQQRPQVEYDVLSIDTGSTPDVRQVPGAEKHSVPVKPIHELQQHWDAFLQRLQRKADDQAAETQRIAVVGSGVGGFELLLALEYRLRTQQCPVEMHWILRGDKPISSRPVKAQELALEAAKDAGITIHTGFDVVAVNADGIESADGRKLPLNEVFWCTAAAAPDWPGSSGLETDRRGFIATNRFLQSLSHPAVFGSGDVATQIDTPSEKAGVFAVRQAPVLFENLRAMVTGQPLSVYKPQKETLSLMALGDKRAIATRGRLTLSGAWTWRWKDHIDQAFMEKLKVLPERQMKSPSLDDMPVELRESINLDLSSVHAGMRCGGCGAKVPASVLQRVMAQLQPVSRSDVLMGLEAGDDAAVIQGSGQAMAQSVDQFRAMVEDPYLFARIAVVHALSDLAAMGAEPQSALALVTLPYAAEAMQQRELFQIMAGALLELNRHHCALTGGHTCEGAESSLGFSVNGWLNAAATQPKPLRPGDSLVLTKALGTGVLLNADMQAKADGVLLRACINSMLQSNFAAADSLKGFDVSGVTDVTGFGLLGHLSQLLKGLPVDCLINATSVPLLPGAKRLAAEGVQSTLLPANLPFLQACRGVDESQSADAVGALLCDPQTSGGLLFGIAASDARACVEMLQLEGYGSATVIGECLPGSGQIELKY